MFLKHYQKLFGMRTIFTFFCISFLCILSFAQSKVAAPKIISTIPAFGDCRVDPQLKEIVIRFDQDMGGGMSILEKMPLRIRIKRIGRIKGLFQFL